MKQDCRKVGHCDFESVCGRGQDVNKVAHSVFMCSAAV